MVMVAENPFSDSRNHGLSEVRLGCCSGEVVFVGSDTIDGERKLFYRHALVYPTFFKRV